jgi:hypothetical protein
MRWQSKEKSRAMPGKKKHEPGPRQIATHRQPDADALVAVWLAERFLFAGEPAEIVFVARTYGPGDAATYDCVVDVGGTCEPARLWFDHKPPAFADRHQSCAARLVWEYLQSQGRAVAHLADLITATHDGDSIVRRAGSKAYRHSRQSGLHAFFARAKAAQPSDSEMYRRVRRWLDRQEAKLRAVGPCLPIP